MPTVFDLVPLPSPTKVGKYGANLDDLNREIEKQFRTSELNRFEAWRIKREEKTGTPFDEAGLANFIADDLGLRSADRTTPESTLAAIRAALGTVPDDFMPSTDAGKGPGTFVSGQEKKARFGDQAITALATQAARVEEAGSEGEVAKRRAIARNQAGRGGTLLTGPMRAIDEDTLLGSKSKLG